MAGPASNPFPSIEMQQRATGRTARWRLSTNENEFGTAPSAVRALISCAQDAHRYPDCAHQALRGALARRHGVDEDAVLVATGIDGLLAQVCRALLRPGAAVVTTAGTYPTFAYFAEAAGAAVHTVGPRRDRADAEALAEAAHRHRAALVYLAEPDNPLGGALGAERVRRLADQLPEPTVLVVDGAYAEYQAAGRRLDARDVVGRRLLWLRTFSKAYGLAGLRVGYCLYDRTAVSGLEHGLEHYAVGRIAEAAALAALDDDRHLERTVALTAAGRAHYRERLAALGCRPLPSETNFVTFRVPGDPGRTGEVTDALRQRGTYVRQVHSPGRPDLIRLSVGPPAQRAEVLALLCDLL
ncbi:putative histidinol-phosphate aminotransferase [Actinacidiphila reveromycinica]|uniref:Putative histidinol-phosphate aminotransferase n=1 Tax=Actinacidiphila reveromycinica TaxID=659352 RepID=A0A7U3UZW5_9ACTN|nr:aminotransferase class I/II-fold pyridoxal phosphate-dependent enzyme [Streptomyces sp. SN-593]BBB01892.1 putative histidinol-phosphate aminotransferase [Streptomyces sp. SN-593]